MNDRRVSKAKPEQSYTPQYTMNEDAVAKRLRRFQEICAMVDAEYVKRAARRLTFHRDREAHNTIATIARHWLSEDESTEHMNTFLYKEEVEFLLQDLDEKEAWQK